MTYVQVVIYRNTENQVVFKIITKVEEANTEEFQYGTEPEMRRKLLELIDTGIKSLP